MSMHSLLQTLNMLMGIPYLKRQWGSRDIERGKTMLEKVVAAAPNRGDLWNVYIDKAIKYQSVDDTRFLFERALESKFGMHTIKNLLFKWQDFEKLRGDDL